MNNKPNILHFADINTGIFLEEYWQKKPLVLRQALPDFTNLLHKELLMQLSYDEHTESRLVVHTPQEKPFWHVTHGPFSKKNYANLPQKNWTLLVQGVDRLLPHIQDLLDYFDFIPQWRVDDVMVSYATEHGGVGPHYDNYDVFLFQAQGQRKWSLTTQRCVAENYVANVPLRIMKKFNVEHEFILEPGDMLYLPPHVGHHGISLSADCITYSFGYRSYQGLEVLNSFCDHLNEQGTFNALYKDPNWNTLAHTSELTAAAWHNAKSLIHSALSCDDTFKNWFGQFVTSLDANAEAQLPDPLDEIEGSDDVLFLSLFQRYTLLRRNPLCKIAYHPATFTDAFKLYINGYVWETDGVDLNLIQLVANHRSLACRQLNVFLTAEENKNFLFELWQLQWLQFA